MDGTVFTEEPTNCDGSDVDIMAAHACTVLIEDLRAEPYNLPWGSHIFARVIATNVIGESLPSDEGNGAQILTNPDAPLNLQNEASITQANQIGLTWSEGTDNGGSSVIDYTVSFKAAAASTYTTKSGVTGLLTTLTSLTQGITYDIKV